MGEKQKAQKRNIIFRLLEALESGSRSEKEAVDTAIKDLNHVDNNGQPADNEGIVFGAIVHRTIEDSNQGNSTPEGIARARTLIIRRRFGRNQKERK